MTPVTSRYGVFPLAGGARRGGGGEWALLCACRCARQGTAAVKPQPPAGICEVSRSGPCDPVGDRQTRTSWETSVAVDWVLSPRGVEKRREGRASEANGVGKGGGGGRDGGPTDVCWLLIWATNPNGGRSAWFFYPGIPFFVHNIPRSSDARMKSFS